MIKLLFKIKRHPFGDLKHVFEIYSPDLQSLNIPYCKLFDMYVSGSKFCVGDYKVAVVEEKDLLFFKIASPEFEELEADKDYIFIEDEKMFLIMAGFKYTVTPC